MSKILVSVVMSVHNANLYHLKCSIKSILNQSFKSFEIIIIDDINDACISSYLNELEMSKNFITIIKNKSNIGLTKSLIKGIKIAKGKYIARQDCDDVSHRDRLKLQVDYIQSNPNIVLLGTSYSILYGEKNFSNHIQPIKHDEIIQSFLWSNPFVHSSVIFSKIIYEKIGGYNPSCKYAQDFDLWPKFIEFGILSNLSDILISRRISKNSVSMNLSTNLYQAFIGAKVRLRERKHFNGKYLLIKIIFFAAKQHFSLYLDFFRLKKK